MASLGLAEGGSGAEPRVTIDGIAPRSKAVLAREHLDRAMPAVAAKAEVAAELHAIGALSVDYADTLKLLNEPQGMF